jgi:signal transduction histidine kinase
MTTAAMIAYPQLRFAASQPQLQGASEMAALVITAMVAILAFARLCRRAAVADLTLACAFTVIASSSLFFAMIPGLLDLPASRTVTWLVILSRLFGSLLFGAAAFVPGRPLRHPGRGPVLLGAGLTVVLLGAWLLARTLPAPFVLRLAAGPAHPAPRATPWLFGPELLTAGFDALAAVGFLIRSRRSGDELAAWLALSALLAAAAHVNYVVYPSLYAGTVAAGDVFRIASYLVLFIGSVRETRSYWATLAEVQVARERRRIARDLHDGLAQELAYLTRHLKRLEGDIGHDELDRLRRATQRARLESQLAVRGLTVTSPAVAAEALSDAVGEVAKRFGLDLELDLDPRLQIPVSRTDALVRIACEAVVNAARHSGTTLIAVSLGRDGPWIRMTVTDQGRGFDPAATHPGFGLISMRERARAAGADLVVTSVPGQGSQIEVRL